MPTVEDYFDDDTDLPLPSSSKPRALPNTGHKGALLEEIDDEADIDFELLAEQGRTVFGEGSKGAPPLSAADKGKMSMRQDPGEIRPTGPAGGGGPRIDPNTPMGGFMGDMLKMQQAEDERMEKLRKQFGGASVQDPGMYKAWNCVYPLYFDAKVSITDGRRVPRQSSVWWPQATQIAQACRSLGLPSVLEPDRCHPADWENPGRVKVQFVRDGKFMNPIVKNRTQLYKHIADQIRQQNPSVKYTPRPKTAKPSKEAESSTAKSKKAKSKANAKAKSAKAQSVPVLFATRPPLPPQPVPTLEDRLPLHSPVHPTGVALASIKRDIETEKENKKKGITPGPSAEEGGKEKQPKVKRIMVRGKR